MVIRNRQSGFNLVELMVVVGIIGILSAVAVPRFSTFKARAIQTEAKSGLNGLFLSMQAYEANYGQFPVFPVGNATAAGVGFAINGNAPKYGYTVVSNAGAWAGKATSSAAIANGATDHQRINANKMACSMFDAVSNTAATAGAGAATYCPQQGAVAVAIVGVDAAN
jgi:type IV pilus assembly protein PilA